MSYSISCIVQLYNMHAVTRGPQCLEVSFTLPYLFPQGEFGFEVWNSLLVSEIVFAGFHFLPRALDIPKWLKNIVMYILVITIGYGVRATMKHFCSIAVLCVSFTWQIVKTHVIRLWKVADPNAYDQIAFCAFHSFLVEVQANPVHIHTVCM